MGKGQFWTLIGFQSQWGCQVTGHSTLKIPERFLCIVPLIKVASIPSDTSQDVRGKYFSNCCNGVCLFVSKWYETYQYFSLDFRLKTQDVNPIYKTGDCSSSLDQSCDSAIES